MRVLILSKDPTIFSPEPGTFGDTRKRHLAYAAALRRRRPGSEIRVITFTDASALVRHEQLDHGLSLYGTRSRHRATYAAGMAARMAAILASGWRPDVITAQTPWEEGTLGLLVARAFGAKFVAQLHFDLFAQEWLRESRLNPARRRLAVMNLRRADGVRVVSTTLKNQLVNRLKVDERRISVVPVGVNFRPENGRKSEFKRRIASSIQDKNVVLFVGRLCPAKNLSLFVDVASRIVRQRADTVFVIAGEGPSGEGLRHRVREEGLGHHFHFLGQLGHEALPPIYAAADVFLLTSHYEGFGRVLAESYWSGVPAVSTRSTGPEDIIEHGISGYLCGRDDADALADAVLRLLNDDEIRNQFGQGGRAFVTERFDRERLCSQLIDCWEAAWHVT